MHFASTSKRATSLSNLKMIGLAVYMYAADYDDWLPQPRSWQDDLFPYMKNDRLFRDPDLTGSGPNVGFAMFAPVAETHFAHYEAPSLVPLAFQSTILGRNAVGDFRSLPIPSRHVDGNGVVYLDGHAKRLPSFCPKVPTVVWREP
jgi:hypothetical protein